MAKGLKRKANSYYYYYYYYYYHTYIHTDIEILKYSNCFKKIMGYSKHIYFTDKTIIEELEKINNPSELINNLLRNHFKNQSLNTLSLEERKRILLEKKQIELINLEALNKIKDVYNGIE